MTDAQMRIRAARLASGDIRQDDLTRLFLFARDRCDGRQIVQELGDFVAHHAERTKGLLSTHAKGWANSVAFFGPRFSKGQQQLGYPAHTPDFISENLKRMNIRELQAQTGLRKDRATLEKIALGCLVRSNDGTFTVSPSTEGERRLLEEIFSRLYARPAFEEDRLILEFLTTLKSNGLLTNEELRDRERYRVPISMFALTAMNLSRALLPTGAYSTLTCHLETDGRLSIHGTAPAVKIGQPNEIGFSTPFYISSVRVEHCDENLVAGADFAVPLEIDSSGKLAAIK